MPCTYQVVEVRGSRRKGRPLYRNTRHPHQLGDPPFSACVHRHASWDEAADCMEFERNEYPAGFALCEP